MVLKVRMRVTKEAALANVRRIIRTKLNILEASEIIFFSDYKSPT